MAQDDVHAVVVRMQTDSGRGEDVDRHLREDVVPWARAQRGFLSGRWLRSDDGRSATGVLLFHSATAASDAAAGPRAAVYPPGNAWSVVGVDECAVVAEADAGRAAAVTGTGAVR